MERIQTLTLWGVNIALLTIFIWGVVTMNIEVDFNIDTIFREWVYVKKL
jgi:hypothetical protein